MAANDFRPSRPGSGGTQHMTSYPLAAAQTFLVGEPLVVNAAGYVAECATNPAAVTGISAAPSTGRATNGITVAVRDTGADIQLYTATPEQVFETDNFATDGAGTSATPTLANVGDTAGFILDGNGDWYVDTGAGNAQVEIIEVVDSIGRILGNPVNNPGAGVTVRFVFV